MYGLIQLVSQANVRIDSKQVATINQGILALIGIEKTDTLESGKKLIDKILHYRIFKDSAGKTNLSLTDVSGGLLLVPQFTLVAETDKGLRPGFSRGMPPTEGKQLFDNLVTLTQTLYPIVKSGVFGADMQVSLTNDGPMTFMLHT